MTSKERIRLLLSGEKTDRLGRAEAPWPHTRERWREEGLPAGVHPNDFFSMDIRRMLKIDASFLLEPELLEESAEFVVARDPNGVLVKRWKDEHGVPQPLEYPIRSPKDWKALRERLVPDEGRFAFGYYGDYGYEYARAPLARLKEMIEACDDLRETFLVVETLDPYEATMARVGDENLLVWMATAPEFVYEMFEAHAELGTACVEMLLDAGVRPDGVFVGGDIAYRNGLLFSPAMYRELLWPHHARMFRFFHERGLKVIYHSDGCVTEALPMLIEGGADCIEPLEVQAGMDLDELAEEFGERVSFMGNVSVKALSATKDGAVEEARRRIRAGRRARGYIFHSDHSLPPTVSFENYSAVMEVFEEEAWL